MQIFICLAEREVFPCVCTSAQSTCGNYCAKKRITGTAAANYSTLISVFRPPPPQTLHLITNREIGTLKAFEEISPRPFSPAGSPTPLHRLRFLFQDVLTMSYTPLVCVSFSTKINYTWGNHLRRTEFISGIAYCCEDVCSRNMENSPFSVELSVSHALLRIVEWVPSNFGV